MIKKLFLFNLLFCLTTTVWATFGDPDDPFYASEDAFTCTDPHLFFCSTAPHWTSYRRIEKMRRNAHPTQGASVALVDDIGNFFFNSQFHRYLDTQGAKALAAGFHNPIFSSAIERDYSQLIEDPDNLMLRVYNRKSAMPSISPALKWHIDGVFMSFVMTAPDSKRRTEYFLNDNNFGGVKHDFALGMNGFQVYDPLQSISAEGITSPNTRMELTVHFGKPAMGAGFYPAIHRAPMFISDTRTTLLATINLKNNDRLSAMLFMWRILDKVESRIDVLIKASNLIRNNASLTEFVRQNMRYEVYGNELDRIFNWDPYSYNQAIQNNAILNECVAIIRDSCNAYPSASPTGI